MWCEGALTRGSWQGISPRFAHAGCGHVTGGGSTIVVASGVRLILQARIYEAAGLGRLDVTRTQ